MKCLQAHEDCCHDVTNVALLSRGCHDVSLVSSYISSEARPKCHNTRISRGGMFSHTTQCHQGVTITNLHTGDIPVTSGMEGHSTQISNNSVSGAPIRNFCPNMFVNFLLEMKMYLWGQETFKWCFLWTKKEWYSQMLYG